MLVELIDRLDESIGAGANTAALRAQLSSIREQAEALEAQLKTLEAQLKGLQANAQSQDLAAKSGDLEEGAVKFLQILFEGDELSVEQIAAKLGMRKGMAEYHCGVLSEKTMIHLMSLGVVLDFEEPSPSTWIITTKGREYLVKHNLVP